MSSSTHKTALRAQALLLRQEHDPLLKVQKDEKILENLEKIPEFTQSSRVLFYLPIKGEVNLEPLFEKYKGKKQFYLPRVDNKQKKLIIHPITSLTETSPGNYDIPEPHDHLPETDPQDLNIILVPGILFDRRGHRIGYGHGHFDRLLKDTAALKIGIAYEFQITNTIPNEPHDEAMNIIITEKNILHC